MLCRDGAGAISVLVFVQSVAVKRDVAATARRVCFCNVECEELYLRARSDVTTTRPHSLWPTYCSGDENVLHNLCHVEIDKGKGQGVVCEVRISPKLGKTVVWLTAHHYQAGCSSSRVGGPQPPRPAQWLPPKLGHASRQARQLMFYAEGGGETQHGTTNTGMEENGRSRMKMAEMCFAKGRTTTGHVNQGLRLVDGRAGGGARVYNCTFFALVSETVRPPCPSEHQNGLGWDGWAERSCQLVSVYGVAASLSDNRPNCRHMRAEKSR